MQVYCITICAKLNIYQPQAGWLIFVLKLLVALMRDGVALYFAMGDTGAWLHYSLMKRLALSSGIGVAGRLRVYFAALFLLGFRPRDYMRRVVQLSAGFSSFTTISRASRYALAIGNFDGMHLGHQALLQANIHEAAKAHNLTPAVMTFEPHPREFFTPQNAPAATVQFA